MSFIRKQMDNKKKRTSGSKMKLVNKSNKAVRKNVKQHITDDFEGF